MPEDGAGSDVRKAVARGLREEGNRSRGAGVNLDDIYFFVLVHDELDVEQAYDADAQAQHFRIVENGFLHGLGEAVGRIDADGVSGVNTGALHKLHDARDKYFLSVADGVHLDFLTADIAVHKDRLVRGNLHGGVQVFAKRGFLGDDLHRAAA